MDLYQNIFPWHNGTVVIRFQLYGGADAKAFLQAAADHTHSLIQDGGANAAMQRAIMIAHPGFRFTAKDVVILFFITADDLKLQHFADGTGIAFTDPLNVLPKAVFHGVCHIIHPVRC